MWRCCLSIVMSFIQPIPSLWQPWTPMDGLPLTSVCCFLSEKGWLYQSETVILSHYQYSTELEGRHSWCRYSSLSHHSYISNKSISALGCHGWLSFINNIPFPYREKGLRFLTWIRTYIKMTICHPNNHPNDGSNEYDAQSSYQVHRYGEAYWALSVSYPFYTSHNAVSVLDLNRWPSFTLNRLFVLPDPEKGCPDKANAAILSQFWYLIELLGRHSEHYGAILVPSHHYYIFNKSMTALSHDGWPCFTFNIPGAQISYLNQHISANSQVGPKHCSKYIMYGGAACILPHPSFIPTKPLSAPDLSGWAFLHLQHIVFLSVQEKWCSGQAVTIILSQYRYQPEL